MSGPKHGVSAEIVDHDPNVWLMTCTCHQRWTAPTYEAGEDKWREHVWRVKGVAPKPMGDRTVARWEATS